MVAGPDRAVLRRKGCRPTGSGLARSSRVEYLFEQVGLAAADEVVGAASVTQGMGRVVEDFRGRKYLHVAQDVVERW